MTGQFIVTTGGDLGVRSVIHLAIPMWQPHSSDSERLKDCIKTTVQKFSIDHLSIAIPVGEFHGYPPKEIDGIVVELLRWVHHVQTPPSRIIILSAQRHELSHLWTLLSNQLTVGLDQSSDHDSLPPAGKSGRIHRSATCLDFYTSICAAHQK